MEKITREEYTLDWSQSKVFLAVFNCYLVGLVSVSRTVRQSLDDQRDCSHRVNKLSLTKALQQSYHWINSDLLVILVVYCV